MSEFTEAYAEAGDPNEQYRLLRREAKRLREERPDNDFMDNEDLLETLRTWDDEFDRALLAFLANDFGKPIAFRPEGTDPQLQDRVRKAILDAKYSPHPERAELETIQEELLSADGKIHKALVAIVDADSLDYFLPKGRTEASSFLTVREPLGLIDWTTNGSSAGKYQETY